MKLFVAGISYKTAPVELRERFAAHPGQLSNHAARLLQAGGLSEVVLLSTCNRVEVYGVTPKVNGNINRLFEQLCPAVLDFAPYLYIKEGAEAVHHLFSVASGLDSMVIGETEITGQVKQAYLAAQSGKLTGRITNRLFQTALQTAKEIRTQTGIGCGATSVGSVAVELAEKIFGPQLSEKTVMIIGAGKMGEACVRHLAKRGAKSLLVSNRSYERAVGLASEFGARAVPFEQAWETLTEADIVVSSTGCPDTIMHAAEVGRAMAQRRNRPLFLIDLAVPRDIDADVARLENVFLYNVDDLEGIVKENLKSRQQELSRCQAILGKRTSALMPRLTAVPERAPVAASRPDFRWALEGAMACPAH